MVHQFELKRSPKSLLLPTIAVLLVLAAFAVMVFFDPLLGLLALAVAGYISYHVVKFFTNTIKSHVRTSEEGMVCATTMGTESKIAWDEITHAGWYTSDSGYRELYVYAEQDDRLLTIPPHYESMDELAREILDRTGLPPLSLSGDDVDGLADALRPHVVAEGEIVDEDSDANEEQIDG
ncbi:MAG: hypothetical protein ACOC2Y_06080 [Spirochaetota bacterium]